MPTALHPASVGLRACQSRCRLQRYPQTKVEAASSSGYTADGDLPSTSERLQTTPEALPASDPPVGLGARMKRFFLGDKLDKEKLKALGCDCAGHFQQLYADACFGGPCLGAARPNLTLPFPCRLGAVASYGAVSNLTYGAGLAVAWIGFVRQMGKSPLMAGQWKAFLAFYAGAVLHASILIICATHFLQSQCLLGS